MNLVILYAFLLASYPSIFCAAVPMARSIGSGCSSRATDAKEERSRRSSLDTPSARMASSGSRLNWFFVSVPVLSEHKISIPAISSIAESLCTTAFSDAITLAPSERTKAVTSEKPAGAATARMTKASSRATSQYSWSRKILIARIARQMRAPATMMIVAALLKTFRRCPTSPSPLSKRAMVFPKNESYPVFSTIIGSSPLTTVPPERTSSPTLLVAGRLSPVREDSSMDIGSPSPISLPSAGTTAPPLRDTTSPGTSSRTATVSHLPSLLQTQVGAESFSTASIALAELLSTKKSASTTTFISPNRRPKPTQSLCPSFSTAAPRIAAIRRIRGTREKYRRSKSCHHGAFFPLTSFHPYFSLSCSTSALERPFNAAAAALFSSSPLVSGTAEGGWAADRAVTETPAAVSATWRV
mmetsp:Transcript_25550/g.49987  ORF Transcript_25550/g.49987 Transcript_25550/m.49987 type:complete len:414 (-) Transcript_25550:219-1460(-)